VLVYRSAMMVAAKALRFVVGSLRAHRREVGIRWRRLSCDRQALMVLAHLRQGKTYRDLAVGFGVGTLLRIDRVAMASGGDRSGARPSATRMVGGVVAVAGRGEDRAESDAGGAQVDWNREGRTGPGHPGHVRPQHLHNRRWAPTAAATPGGSRGPRLRCAA
jgi:hypothetical protein